MADGMDWMDVQAQVDKACNSERSARQRHIEDIARDLRAEFRRETMELREEVGELVAEVHQLIQREKELRDEGDAAVLRMARSVAEAGA
jgi:uncharacterized coiled-coil DUF342 family protein